jgi:hypothetical protein
MFGPREMLLSSQEPVVRQFLNAQRQGPIGMAEEKDAAELEAEGDAELPPLPPIPPQIPPSNGEPRRTQREAGLWLRENKVSPPPGSFTGEGSYANSAAMAPPASTQPPAARTDRPDGDDERPSVRILPSSSRTSDSDQAAPAKRAAAKRAPAKSATPTTRKTATKSAGGSATKSAARKAPAEKSS